MLSAREDKKIVGMKSRALRRSVIVCLLLLLCVFSAETNAQQPPPASGADAVIPKACLLQPSEVEQILQSSTGEKPLILQVGSHIFYAQAHIRGSEYVGAAGENSGRQSLRERINGLERTRFILIYCGCCPWQKCPNIRPAYQELVSMGFTNVKVLYISQNFGTNWVAEGYPIAKGR